MDMKEFIDFLKTLATEEKDETRKAKLEDVIEKLEKKEFVTGFVQFKVLDFDKAVKSAEDEDKYEVDLSVPSITDEMENIQLLCYNKEKNGALLNQSVLTRKIRQLKLLWKISAILLLSQMRKRKTLQNNLF